MASTNPFAQDRKQAPYSSSSSSAAATCTGTTSTATTPGNPFATNTSGSAAATSSSTETRTKNPFANREHASHAHDTQGHQVSRHAELFPKQQISANAPSPVPANTSLGSQGIIMEEEKTYYFMPSKNASQAQVAQMRFWRPSLQQLAFSKLWGVASVPLETEKIMGNVFSRTGLPNTALLYRNTKPVVLKLRGALITATSNVKGAAPLFHIPLNPTSSVLPATASLGSPPTNDIFSGLFKTLPRAHVWWDVDGYGHFSASPSVAPSKSDLPFVLALWTSNPVSSENQCQTQRKLAGYLKFDDILQYFQWADAIDNVIKILKGHFDLPASPSPPKLVKVLPRLYHDEKLKWALRENAQKELSTLEEIPACDNGLSKVSLNSRSATVVWEHPLPDRNAERITEFILQVFLDRKLKKTLRLPFFEIEAVRGPNFEKLNVGKGAICLDEAVEDIVGFAERPSCGQAQDTQRKQSEATHLFCSVVDELEENSNYDFRVLSVNRFGYSPRDIGNEQLGSCKTLTSVPEIKINGLGAVAAHPEALLLRWNLDVDDVSDFMIGSICNTHQERQVYQPFSRLLSSLAEDASPPDGFVLEVVQADTDQLDFWDGGNSLPLSSSGKIVFIPFGVACRMKACLESDSATDNFVMQQDEYKRTNSCLNSMRVVEEAELTEDDESQVAFSGFIEGLPTEKAFFVRSCLHCGDELSPFSEYFGPFRTLGKPTIHPPPLSLLKDKVSSKSIAAQVPVPDLGKFDAPLDGMDVSIVSAHSQKEFAEKIDLKDANSISLFDCSIRNSFDAPRSDANDGVTVVGHFKFIDRSISNFPVTFQGLKPDTQYYLVSRAFNSVGYGPFTRTPLVAHTLGPPTVPPEPPTRCNNVNDMLSVSLPSDLFDSVREFGDVTAEKEFRYSIKLEHQPIVHGVGVTCVWLQWTEAELGDYDAPILGYTISWKTLENANASASDFPVEDTQLLHTDGGANQTDICIQGIPPHQQVVFCVRAWNEAGIGPYGEFSRPVQMLLPPKNSPSAPHLPDKLVKDCACIFSEYERAAKTLQQQFEHLFKFFDTSDLSVCSGLYSDKISLVVDTLNIDLSGDEEAPYNAMVLEYKSYESDDAETDVSFNEGDGRFLVDLQRSATYNGLTQLLNLAPGKIYRFYSRYLNAAGPGCRSELSEKVKTRGAPKGGCPIPIPCEADEMSVCVMVASTNLGNMLIHCGSVDAPYVGLEIEYSGYPVDRRGSMMETDNKDQGIRTLTMSQLCSGSTNESADVIGIMEDSKMNVRIKNLRSLHQYSFRTRIVNKLGCSAWSEWSEMMKAAITPGPPCVPPPYVKVVRILDGIEDEESTIPIVLHELVAVETRAPVLGEYEGALEGMMVEVAELSISTRDELSEKAFLDGVSRQLSNEETSELLKTMENDGRCHVMKLKFPLSKLEKNSSGNYCFTIQDLNPNKWFFVRIYGVNKAGTSPPSELSLSTVFFTRGIPAKIKNAVRCTQRSARYLVCEYGIAEEEDIPTMVSNYLSDKDDNHKYHILTSGAPSHVAFNCYRRSSDSVAICSETAELEQPKKSTVEKVGKMFSDIGISVNDPYLDFVAKSVARYFCHAKAVVRKLVPGKAYRIQSQLLNEEGSRGNNNVYLDTSTIAAPASPPKTSNLHIFKPPQAEDNVFSATTFDTSINDEESLSIPVEPCYKVEVENDDLDQLWLLLKMNLSESVRASDPSSISVRIGYVFEATRDAPDENDFNQESTFFVSWISTLGYHISNECVTPALAIPFHQLLMVPAIQSHISDFRQVLNASSSQWLGRDQGEMQMSNKLELMFVFSTSISTEAGSSSWTYDVDAAHQGSSELQSANLALEVKYSKFHPSASRNGEIRADSTHDGGNNFNSPRNDTGQSFVENETNRKTGTQSGSASNRRNAAMGNSQSMINNQHGTANECTPGQASASIGTASTAAATAFSQSDQTTTNGIEKPPTGANRNSLPRTNAFVLPSASEIFDDSSLNSTKLDNTHSSTDTKTDASNRRTGGYSAASSTSTLSTRTSVPRTTASALNENEKTRETSDGRSTKPANVGNTQRFTDASSGVNTERSAALDRPVSEVVPTTASQATKPSSQSALPSQTTSATAKKSTAKETKTTSFTGNKTSSTHVTSKDGTMSGSKTSEVSTKKLTPASTHLEKETNVNDTKAIPGKVQPNKHSLEESQTATQRRNRNSSKENNDSNVNPAKYGQDTMRLVDTINAGTLNTFRCKICSAALQSGMLFCNYCGNSVPFDYDTVELEPLYTYEQLFAQHDQDETCSSCHTALPCSVDGQPRYCYYCGGTLSLSHSTL